MVEDDFEDEGQDNLSPEQIAKMQRENCIFCKIISGEIPSKKVYEDSDFVGILDINPAADGHVLLLPKQHFQILPQIPQEIVGNLGVACSNVSSKILRAFKCEGTSVFMANGAVAGQRAPHFMVHIIPRKENDDISLNPSLKEIDDNSFESIKEKLFSSMKTPPTQKTRTQTAEFEEIDEEKEIQEDVVKERFSESEEEKKKELDSAALESKFEEETKKELNKKSKRYEQDEEDEAEQKKKVAAKKKKKTDNKKPEDKRQQEDTNIDFDKLARMFK
jgi:histidine triad (HIT) family protein